MKKLALVSWLFKIVYSNNLFLYVSQIIYYLIFFYLYFLVNDDLDGQPLDDITALKESDMSSKFKPSKWETIDPETVEAQGIILLSYKY